MIAKRCEPGLLSSKYGKIALVQQSANKSSLGSSLLSLLQTIRVKPESAAVSQAYTAIQILITQDVMVALNVPGRPGATPHPKLLISSTQTWSERSPDMSTNRVRRVEQAFRRTAEQRHAFHAKTNSVSAWTCRYFWNFLPQCAAQRPEKKWRPTAVTPNFEQFSPE